LFFVKETATGGKTMKKKVLWIFISLIALSIIGGNFTSNKLEAQTQSLSVPITNNANQNGAVIDSPVPIGNPLALEGALAELVASSNVYTLVGGAGLAGGAGGAAMAAGGGFSDGAEIRVANYN